jgi:hypothetical protein
VWAKSHGDSGTATGPGTDGHHLRPEDVTVNSTRSNKDSDNGGTAVGQRADCWSDADSFEPRDAVKGDVARMILSMAIPEPRSSTTRSGRTRSSPSHPTTFSGDHGGCAEMRSPRGS